MNVQSTPVSGHEEILKNLGPLANCAQAPLSLGYRTTPRRLGRDFRKGGLWVDLLFRMTCLEALFPLLWKTCGKPWVGGAQIFGGFSGFSA